MLTHPTLDRRCQRRLATFADAWQQQPRAPTVADLPFDDRLTWLVEAEGRSRQNHAARTTVAGAPRRSPGGH